MQTAKKKQDENTIVVGIVGLVLAVAITIMAGPVALGIATAVLLVGVALDVFLIAIIPLVIGLGLAVSPWSQFFTGFWSERLNGLKHALFGGDLDAFFLSDMLSLELIALGLMMGGVFGFGMGVFERSPARRAYREARRGDGATGSLNWMVKSKAQKVAVAPAYTTGGTVIGVDVKTRKPLILPDKSLNTHLLVAGTTGAGKTVTVGNIVESFMAQGKAIIYIDGKGDFELAKQIGDLARSVDCPIWNFSMEGPSCKYNPLASGGFTSKRDRVIELQEWSEPYYKRLAEGYLQTVFKILEAVGQPTDLISATEYLSRPKLTKLLRSKSSDIGKKLAKQLSDELEDQVNAEEHIEGLRAELRNLSRSELGPLFDLSGSGSHIGSTDVVDDEAAPEAVGEGQDEQDPVLTMPEVIRTGGVAYISLQPLKFPVLADILGKLVVNDVKASLDPANPRDVLVVVDEFTTLAGPQILNMLNQGRSRGVHGIVTVQGLSDLGQKISRNAMMFVEQIISNCNVYAIHRMNSDKDAEKLSKIIGTKWGMEVSAQVGDSGATGMGNARRVKVNIADPTEIQDLPTGRALFLDKNTGKFAHFLARKGWLF